MAVHIRLQRKGSTHYPFYHLIATDQRNPRDGRFLEKLGYYDPNKEPSTVHIQSDRVQYWYERGAQLSNVVAKLVKIKEVTLTRQPQLDNEASQTSAQVATSSETAPAVEAKPVASDIKASVANESVTSGSERGHSESKQEVEKETEVEKPKDSNPV